MTVPGEKDPGSLVARRKSVAEGTWFVAWRSPAGEPRGIVFQGPLDELSEWAYAHGFTGVEVRPPLY